MILMKGRAASKLVPNRRLFGNGFDWPGTGQKRIGKTSNLPASKAAGQGDCDYTNGLDVYEQTVFFVDASVFIGSHTVGVDHAS
ncbi:MAG: hypothetical protein JSW59_13270 [Phycisphaerales bacterium]|nr:MAG: hypothetical protein JSW59_13270 [Phycisphaerales bacterium]